MSSKFLDRVQASFKLHLLLWMVRVRSNGNGLDQQSIRKITTYLRVSLGLEQPSYTHMLQRPPLLFPGLLAKPWHIPSDFPWTSVLENQYETIKAEFSHIFAPGLFRPQHQGVADKGQWQVYYLYHFGRKAHDNCRRCPRTAQLIESFPSVSNSGSAYFSILEPETHLAPHYGRANTKLRCHLALTIPDHCHIRVGTETRSWEEGTCMVFDDSFDHEAWNLSPRPRAVLIIDFWHPDLTAGERRALELIMNLSPKARKNARLLLKTNVGL